MEIKLVTNNDDFMELRDYWNDLLLKSGSHHIHLTHEWLSTWWKYFNVNKKLYIILVYNEKKLVGIAPFMLQKVGKLIKNSMKFRQLNFLGTGLIDTADFIISEKREEVFDIIFNELLKIENDWDEIYLKQIRSDSPNFLLFQKYLLTRKFDSKLFSHSGCPIIQTSGDFDAYYKGVSKSWRKNNDRNIRNLNEKGNLSFEISDNFNKSELDQIIKLNEKKLDMDGGNSDFRNRFTDQVLVDFLTDVIPILSADNGYIMFLLKHENIILSYSISYKFNNVLYIWNTSYDPEFASFSPGRIIIKYILQYCFENNFSHLDWMAGVYQNKMKWTSEKVDLNTFTMKKRNLKTAIANIYSTFKNKIKS